jgi:hypothetical protein
MWRGKGKRLSRRIPLNKFMKYLRSNLSWTGNIGFLLALAVSLVGLSKNSKAAPRDQVKLVHLRCNAHQLRSKDNANAFRHDPTSRLLPRVNILLRGTLSLRGGTSQEHFDEAQLKFFKEHYDWLANPYDARPNATESERSGQT